MKSIYSLLLFHLFFALGLAAQCFDADETIWLDTWASCQISPNPKSEYGNSHWIQYDFGDNRNLSKTWVWNTNDPNKLSQGFNQVKIDYSNDGTNWTYWGEMNFPMAQGEAVYGGFPGPDMFGISARYVLLTAMSNHGDPGCSGIAEIKFNLYPELIEGEYNDSVLICEAGFEEGIYIFDVTSSSAVISFPFDVGPGLSFNLEYRPFGEAEWTVITGLVESGFGLEFLSPETTYEVRAIAFCNGETIPSEISTFTTLEGEEECARVEDIWLVEATTNTATIEWEPAGELDFYFIRYGPSSSPNFTEAAEAESTTIFLDELEPFTEYKMRVGVFCGNDQLNYSDEFTFMTGITSTDNPLADKNTMRLFPNPTPGRFTLEYQSEIRDLLTYTISDVTGKILQSNSLRIGSGINIHPINLANLPTGVYVLNTQAQSSGALISEKIIKI